MDQENSLDSSSVSASSNDNIKVSLEDLVLVQNLIERCLQLYMDKDEVVNNLLNRAGIHQEFTKIAWQRLEEQNADFFRDYNIRLKLKKQITLFNQLLEHQDHAMKHPVPPKVPLAPIQNEIRPMSGAVNNLSMEYSVIQPPPTPVTRQPNCSMVNGVPAPANFNPMQMNSGNESDRRQNEMAKGSTP